VAEGGPAGGRSASGTPEADEPHVTLAAVAGAHGVGGEVRLKLFAAGLESLKRHQKVRVGESDLTLKSVRGGKLAVVRFAEVVARDAAEAMRGQLVSVPRSALPPLEEGEYYHADLLGLPCLGPAGETLGRVVAVENFGAGDILEIELEEGRRTMVPFRPGTADLGDGAIRIDPAFLA
jgi:16S rRNA processing protein RimM